MAKAIHLRAGPILIEGFAELPPQSWKRFQCQLSVQVFRGESDAE